LALRTKFIHVFTLVSDHSHIGKDRNIIIGFPEQGEYFTRSSGLKVKACFVRFDDSEHIALCDIVSNIYFPFS
jgi:hypothetical protein